MDAPLTEIIAPSYPSNQSVPPSVDYDHASAIYVAYVPPPPAASNLAENFYPPWGDPEPVLRRWIYHRTTLIVSVILWQVILLLHLLIFAYSCILYSGPVVDSLIGFCGMLFSFVFIFFSSHQAFRFWCLCCSSDPGKAIVCCFNAYTGQQRCFLASFVQVFGATLQFVCEKTHPRSQLVSYHIDTVVIVFLVLGWLFWIAQAVLNLWSRFRAFEIDFPNESTELEEPVFTTCRNLLQFPFLHEIAVGVWGMIILAWFTVAFIAVHAVYTMCFITNRGEKSDLASGQPAWMELGIIFISAVTISSFGLKHLLFRSLGQKKPLSRCDKYELWAVSMAYPLISLLLATVMHIVATLPQFNVSFSDHEFTSWAISHAVQRQAAMMQKFSALVLLFSWIGWAVLAACNFLPLWSCVRAKIAESSREPVPSDEQTGSR
jgi:hypothetical protein